jgi:hypothetical protein
VTDKGGGGGGGFWGNADPHSAEGDMREVDVSGGDGVDEEFAGVGDGQAAGGVHVPDPGRHRQRWHSPAQRRANAHEGEDRQDANSGRRHLRCNQERPSQGKHTLTTITGHLSKKKRRKHILVGGLLISVLSAGEACR